MQHFEVCLIFRRKGLEERVVSGIFEFHKEVPAVKSVPPARRSCYRNRAP